MIQRLPHSAFWGESGERWGKLGWESGGGFGEVLGKIWGPIFNSSEFFGIPNFEWGRFWGPILILREFFGAPNFGFGRFWGPILILRNSSGSPILSGADFGAPF